MMKLTLEPSVSAREDEIPIAAGASVVSPMRNRRIVAENRVQCDFGFVVVTEIFRPVVNFFLARRIPRHLTAKGIGLRSPSICACPHSLLEIGGFILHSFELQVGKNLEKN